MGGTGNRSHRVNLCRWARPGGAREGRLKLFAFGWLDLSMLLAVDVRKVQRMARSGVFDPLDLASVAAFWRDRPDLSVQRGER